MNWDRLQARDRVSSRGGERAGADLVRANRKDDYEHSMSKLFDGLLKRCLVPGRQHDFEKYVRIPHLEDTKLRQCRRCRWTELHLAEPRVRMLLPDRQYLERNVYDLQRRRAGLDIGVKQKMDRPVPIPGPNRSQGSTSKRLMPLVFDAAIHRVHFRPEIGRWMCMCSWWGKSFASADKALDAHRREWNSQKVSSKIEADLDALEYLLETLYLWRKTT